jgi:DNA-binding response OmpR family regulator
MCILIVDRQIGRAMAIQTTLQHDHYPSSRVTSVTDALHFVNQVRCFMVMVGDVEGSIVETCATLRQIGLPLIVYGEDWSLLNQAYIQRLGADAGLMYPCTAYELIDAVSAHFPSITYNR